MGNASRFGAYLMAVGGIVLTVLALEDGVRRAAMILGGLAFFVGLAIFNAGLREDDQRKSD